MTHVVEIDGRHLHQTERQHRVADLQPDPDILPRVLRAETEHDQAAGGDKQPGEAGRQPALRLGEAVALVLGLAEQSRVRGDVGVCRRNERSDDWADVYQTGVCTPVVYRILVSRVVPSW